MMQTTVLNKLAPVLERIEQTLATMTIQERWAVIALLMSQTTALACEELKTTHQSVAALAKEHSTVEHRPVEPQPAKTEPAYLTEREVAYRLNVSLALLRKWRIQKKGPKFVKVGRLVRYARRDIEAFMP
jgi:excisionase family DNA binding protein